MEVKANPTPRTVSVTPAAPGFMLAGETISTNGTGLVVADTCAAKIVPHKISATAAKAPRSSKDTNVRRRAENRDAGMGGKSSWVSSDAIQHP
jgi:hypothetical protein